MKIPDILTIKQAIVLAIAAVVLAAFLKVFGGLAVTLLFAIAFILFVYAAIKKWLPEVIEPKKP